MLPLFTLKDMTRIFLIGRNHITKVAQVMAHQGRAGQLLDLLVYLRALTACYLFLFSYLYQFGLGFEWALHSDSDWLR